MEHFYIYLVYLYCRNIEPYNITMIRSTQTCGNSVIPLQQPAIINGGLSIQILFLISPQSSPFNVQVFREPLDMSADAKQCKTCERSMVKKDGSPQQGSNCSTCRSRNTRTRSIKKKLSSPHQGSLFLSIHDQLLWQQD
jgi:hypothetical protein